MAVEPRDGKGARWGITGALVAGAFVAGTIALGVVGVLRWDRESLGYGLVLAIGLAALFSMIRNLRGKTGANWPWHPPQWLQAVVIFTILMLAYLSKALNLYGSIITSVLVAAGLTFFWVVVGYLLPWWFERR